MYERNGKKEYAWAKQKYSRIDVRIDKEIGDTLKKELQKDGISMSNWITEQAKKYLENK